VKIGKFEILEKLSDGPTASVFKAYQMDLERVVLLKVLHPHLQSDPELVARFRREARAGARLDSECIVHVFDLIESDESIAIAMEFVEGISLRELFPHCGKLNLSAGLTIASGVLKALAYAHAHGVLHRDVKPSNILLTTNGGVKLTDFGLACIVNATSLTTEGTLLGTPAYMSPEQARGEPLDGRTDLFSLGVTVYEMFSGIKVFGGDSYTACLHKIQTLTPRPLDELRNDVPPSVAHWVAKLMTKMREDRYTSSEEALAELTRLQSSLGIASSQGELAQLVLSLISSRKLSASKGVLSAQVTRGAVAEKPLSPPITSDTIESESVPIVTSWKRRAGKSSIRFVYIASLIGIAAILILYVPFKTAYQTMEPSESRFIEHVARESTRTIQLDSHTIGVQSQNAPQTDRVYQMEPSPARITTESLATLKVPHEKEAVTQSVSGTGEVEISCVPWAKVYVDGQYWETTPLTNPIILTAGKHAVTFINPLFTPIAESLEVNSGERLRLNIDFLAKSGFLKIAVQPWAEVFIDDEKRGTTPLSAPIVVEAGKHRISLRNPAFRMWGKEVNIPLRDTLSLNVILEPIR